MTQYLRSDWMSGVGVTKSLVDAVRAVHEAANPMKKDQKTDSDASTVKNSQNFDGGKVLSKGGKTAVDTKPKIDNNSQNEEVVDEGKTFKDSEDKNKFKDKYKKIKDARKAKEKGKDAANEETVTEKYEGFKKVEASAKKSGASNPAAVAAAAGMKKYGKKKFEAAAHAGKKMGKVKEEVEAIDERSTSDDRHDKHNKKEAFKKYLSTGKLEKPKTTKKVDLTKEETDLEEGKTYKDSEYSDRKKFTDRKKERKEKDKKKDAANEEIDFSEEELENILSIAKEQKLEDITEETINEKRGRPSSSGDKDDDEGSEAGQHPIAQHRKNISLRGAHVFKFKNGDTHQLTTNMSHKVIQHHDSLGKPHEKDAFAQTIHKSKADCYRTMARL